MSLFKSITLATSLDGSAQDGAALCGFQCANRRQPGCLTINPKVRVHSCERELNCIGLESSDVVRITPIIKRSDGETISEIGAGGGGWDLVQAQELELKDASTAMDLMEICSENIKDEQALSKTLRLISRGMKSANKTVFLGALQLARGTEAIPLKVLTEILMEITYENRTNMQNNSIPTHTLRTNKPQNIGVSKYPLPTEIVSYIIPSI